MWPKLEGLGLGLEVCGGNEEDISYPEIFLDSRRMLNASCLFCFEVAFHQNHHSPLDVKRKFGFLPTEICRHRFPKVENVCCPSLQSSAPNPGETAIAHPWMARPHAQAVFARIRAALGPWRACPFERRFLCHFVHP